MGSTPRRKFISSATQVGVGALSTPAPYAGDDASATLAPGVRIHQYELIRELGRGGMGVVFAARDIRLGRRVAIKFVLHAAREVAERFLVEARATAQCDHENIVIVHAVDEYEGMPYMVLEFLEGHTLRELAEAQPRMPPSRVVELMLPISRALARAHDRGIIHRDLKPENVFVTSVGQVKVLDFGISTALGSDDNELMVGTIAYMSPEQMGIDSIDHRADLWAAGIIMFELLAGRHPIDPPDAQELINSAASDEPMVGIAMIEPTVPPALAAVVDACLVKRKAQRIGTAAELADQLAALLPGRAGRRLAEGESPFPGLVVFQEGDADRFFGRTREVARMVAMIREQPLTGVVGPSGAGKSSFVRAGVVPALKASGEPWTTHTLRPGRNPLATLARLVPGLDPARLAIEPGLLGVALREEARRTASHVLLFVDQFEELYTLAPDAAVRRAVTAALLGVADDASAPVRVVVSMRSDFVDRVAEDPRFVDELSRGLLFMTTPDATGLREAIVEPIELVGYRFEAPGIVDEMLYALLGTPGALPLLQFAASRLWDARDRAARLLTVASYRAIGGISGALATHADEVLAGMDQASRRLAQKIFRALVTPERTRAIAELDDLGQLAADRAEVARTIDQLVAARLLVAQTRGDAAGSTVEIVHESLIDRWPTLRRWLDADEEDAAYVAQIAAAAKQWDQRGRPAGLLWRGDALDEIRRWLGARPRDLAGRDRAFVDAAIAVGRRGRTIRRVALTGAFVLLVGVATGAIVAYLRVQAAEDKASVNLIEAESGRTRAEAALRDKATAEQRQKDEEQRRHDAESSQQATSKDLAASREELAAENAKLHDAVKSAVDARARAERATTEARTAASETDKARRALEVELHAKQAHIQELEDEKKKLSTKLKTR